MILNRPMRTCAAFVLSLVLIRGAALAQPAAPPGNVTPLSQSLRGPAKGAYESAKLLVANHDSAGALSKFRQAYEISKDPRLLYDMAVCEKNLNHYAQMQGLLQEYLRDSGPRLSADERAMVDGALEATKNLVAAVTLTANEHGAAVLVDGEAGGSTPLMGPLLVDLGKHVLIVRKPGFEPVTQAIDVAGGSESTVAVTLRPPSHVAELAVSGDGVPLSPPGAGPSPPVTAWIFTGVALAAFASGTYFGLAGVGQLNQDEGPSGCAGHCASSETDSIRTQLAIASVSLGIGVVSTCLATYFFLRPRGRPPLPAIAVDFVSRPGGAVAAVTGHF